MKKLYKIRLQRHFILNLQQMNEVTRHFCWHQNCVCPCSGAIYIYKIMKKNCIKSDIKEILFKVATNERNDKMFLLTSNFIPKGLSAPAPGLYTCIKSDLKEMFLKRVANDLSDKRFLLTSIFCPLGLSAPDLRLYTFIKSWKDVCKARSWRDSF